MGFRSFSGAFSKRFCLLWWLALGVGSSAAAQAPTYGSEAPIPPAQQESDPYLAGHVYLDGVFPFERRDICPPGQGCVMNGGGGIGGVIERRWDNGLRVGLGYSAWFLDSDAVYEVTVVQSLMASASYQFLGARRVHPVFGLALGAITLGETNGIASIGGGVELQLGAEIEMSDDLALSIGLPWRLFSLSSFVAPSDRVRRGVGTDINVVAAFRVGLVLLQDI